MTLLVSEINENLELLFEVICSVINQKQSAKGISSKSCPEKLMLLKNGLISGVLQNCFESYETEMHAIHSAKRWIFSDKISI